MLLLNHRKRIFNSVLQGLWIFTPADKPRLELSVAIGISTEQENVRKMVDACEIRTVFC
jgi:hypothetical protein